MPGMIPPRFHAHIPADRVALYPPEKRGDSKLLVVDRHASRVIHVGKFSDITGFIHNDLIVLNETKVLPARVFGKRQTGGAVELLFMPVTIEPPDGIQPSHSNSAVRISALVSSSRHPGSGLVLTLPEDASFIIEGASRHGGYVGIWSSSNGEAFQDWLERVGIPPLPPYIKRSVEDSDRERYQTVYAEKPGSIAAPTAGLHFTPELLGELEGKSARIVRLTLDVGWGTFEPVKSADLSQHTMHSETYYIPAEAATAINGAHASGRKVLAVGTTSVRALEAAAVEGLPVRSGPGEARLFIYPPYEFQVVDRLLTNFHRPDSTLLHLVAAMIGWDLLNTAYQRALNEDFRFFSYGDAMLII